jgi:hypothetical protein
MLSHTSFIDLVLLTTNNSRLRTLPEWQDIFTEADPRFGKVRLFTVNGSAHAILEVVWGGK